MSKLTEALESMRGHGLSEVAGAGIARAGKKVAGMIRSNLVSMAISDMKRARNGLAEALAAFSSMSDLDDRGKDLLSNLLTVVSSRLLGTIGYVRAIADFIKQGDYEEAEKNLAYVRRELKMSEYRPADPTKW